jgi:hypothetical protein
LPSRPPLPTKQIPLNLAYAILITMSELTAHDDSREFLGEDAPQINLNWDLCPSLAEICHTFDHAPNDAERKVTLVTASGEPLTFTITAAEHDPNDEWPRSNTPQHWDPAFLMFTGKVGNHPDDWLLIIGRDMDPLRSLVWNGNPLRLS